MHCLDGQEVKGRLDRSLTRADIEATTPYNTYRIKGLPPGPIANPGRAALEAVLNPEDTDKLYFVADGSGGHGVDDDDDSKHHDIDPSTDDHDDDG